MSSPFLSELRIFSFNFAPKGWALCNGQLLPINQNAPLFSLLGTTYGGDGRVNFALPDLRGRVPINYQNGFDLGQRAGEEFHTLITSEMALHNHTLHAQALTATIGLAGREPGPTAFLAQAVTGSQANQIAVQMYSSSTSPNETFAPTAIGNGGGSQPHENRQPFLVLNICIALQGIFPSQN